MVASSRTSTLSGLDSQTIRRAENSFVIPSSILPEWLRTHTTPTEFPLVGSGLSSTTEVVDFIIDEEVQSEEE